MKTFALATALGLASFSSPAAAGLLTEVKSHLNNGRMKTSVDTTVILTPGKEATLYGQRSEPVTPSGHSVEGNEGPKNLSAVRFALILLPSPRQYPIYEFRIYEKSPDSFGETLIAHAKFQTGLGEVAEVKAASRAAGDYGLKLKAVRWQH